MQITSNRKTVWINDNEGTCLGRFSAFGIDVHKTAREQLSSGSSCLACKVGPVTVADWRAFQAVMLRAHKIKLDDRYMPSFLSDQTEG